MDSALINYPFISVNMPVYNGEKHIKQAIDSILNQTIQDFELIVVDDGSNDRTQEILAEYDDPRIKIFKNIFQEYFKIQLN